MFHSMKAVIDPYLRTADEQPVATRLEWSQYESRNPHEAWDLRQTSRDFSNELRERVPRFRAAEPPLQMM